MRAKQRPYPSKPLGDPAPLPPGTPDWITPDLVRLTIETWQPYYLDSLTGEEAVMMLLNVGRLFGLLGRE